MPSVPNHGPFISADWPILLTIVLDFKKKTIKWNGRSGSLERKLTALIPALRLSDELEMTVNLRNTKRRSSVRAGNRGCGIWVMSSSLPQLSGNRIVQNCIYGVAVFCRKDSEDGREGGGYLSGHGGVVGGDNFNEEGELLAWESDLDSEDERFSSRRPVSVALVEGNYIGHNGGEGAGARRGGARGDPRGLGRARFRGADTECKNKRKRLRSLTLHGRETFWSRNKTVLFSQVENISLF